MFLEMGHYCSQNTTGVAVEIQGGAEQADTPHIRNMVVKEEMQIFFYIFFSLSAFHMFTVYSDAAVSRRLKNRILQVCSFVFVK